MRSLIKKLLENHYVLFGYLILSFIFVYLSKLLGFPDWKRLIAAISFSGGYISLSDYFGELSRTQYKSQIYTMQVFLDTKHYGKRFLKLGLRMTALNKDKAEQYSIDILEWKDAVKSLRKEKTKRYNQIIRQGRKVLIYRYFSIVIYILSMLIFLLILFVPQMASWAAPLQDNMTINAFFLVLITQLLRSATPLLTKRAQEQDEQVKILLDSFLTSATTFVDKYAKVKGQNKNAD